MVNTDRNDYNIRGDKQPDPCLNIRVLRHGAYLGYLIYIFTDGEKQYMQIEDLVSKKLIETTEVSKDAFESFVYCKEYIKDMLLLDSIWNIHKEKILSGVDIETIYKNKPDSSKKRLGKIPEAWRRVRDGERPEFLENAPSPPLLTGGCKLISKGASK